MAKVRSKGNKSTELKLKMALVSSRLGGFTLDNREVFGRPDFFWAESQLAVFVDGCYWHGCPKHGRMPKSNRDYWEAKIIRNKERDKAVMRALKGQGIKALRIWEHELKDDLEKCVEKIIIELFGLDV